MADKPKLDKLGRRIPQFDRSAAGKKADKTLKEKYGPDYKSRIGANGGRLRTRGYFGKLKDENKTAELRQLAIKGAEKTNEIKAKKKSSGKLSAPLRGPTAPAVQAKKKDNG